MKDPYAKIREDLEDLEDRLDLDDAAGQELAFQGYEMAYKGRVLETVPAKRAKCYLAARVACKLLRDHINLKEAS